jgi:WD40 repeat protein
MKKLALFAVALLGTTALPALAHHAFSAEFDSSKPVTLKGVVTKIEWMNPHTWFYVDTKTDGGDVEHWQCETGAPIELVRRGWKKSDLKVGDQVTVQGFRAKDGTNTANARLVTLPDGKKVFSGSADDGGPTTQPPATHE